MLKIENLYKKYENQVIFNNLNVHFKKGKNYIILGPSGIGKSTLLNLISKIDTNYKGNIISDTDKIAYVFQEDRLLPWLNVEKNIEYVMKEKKDISPLLNLLEIDNIKYKLARELSGGQKQRVAIARAFSTEPKLLLMDESLKSLDLQLKYKIIEELLILMKENHTTLVFVSHDIEEALLLGDIVLIFNKEGQLMDNIEIDLPREGRRYEREKLLKYELKIQKKLDIFFEI